MSKFMMGISWDIQLRYTPRLDLIFLCLKKDLLRRTISPVGDLKSKLTIFYMEACCNYGNLYTPKMGSIFGNFSRSKTNISYRVPQPLVLMLQFEALWSSTRCFSSSTPTPKKRPTCPTLSARRQSTVQ